MNNYTLTECPSKVETRSNLIAKVAKLSLNTWNKVVATYNTFMEKTNSVIKKDITEPAPSVKAIDSNHDYEANPKIIESNDNFTITSQGITSVTANGPARAIRVRDNFFTTLKNKFLISIEQKKIEPREMIKTINIVEKPKEELLSKLDEVLEKKEEQPTKTEQKLVEVNPSSVISEDKNGLGTKALNDRFERLNRELLELRAKLDSITAKDQEKKPITVVTYKNASQQDDTSIKHVV